MIPPFIQLCALNAAETWAKRKIPVPSVANGRYRRNPVSGRWHVWNGRNYVPYEGDMS